MDFLEAHGLTASDPSVSIFYGPGGLFRKGLSQDTAKQYLTFMKDVILPKRISEVSGPASTSEASEMKSYVEYLETILKSVP